MKKIYFIIPLFLVIFVVAGCSNKNKQAESNSQDNNQSQEQQVQDNQSPKWNENFDEASLSDLAISQQILVMGNENSDGSILAEQIIIGDDKTDFQNMGGFMRPQTNGNNGDQQSPPNFEGQQPDFEKFQDMSDEERAKMREEMMAQRQALGNGAGRGTGNANMARLGGEIIEKDEQSLTLKLNEGGSKLVFFSETTKVLKIRPVESLEPTE